MPKNANMPPFGRVTTTKEHYQMETTQHKEFGILTEKPDTNPGSTPADKTFYTRSTVFGIIAGALMSLFIGVSGFYITGDNPGFGFFKYLILGGALVVLLNQIKRHSQAGQTLKDGIVYGLYTSAVAAVVTSVAALLFGGPNALRGAVTETSDVVVTRGTLAGMTFFITLVAGLILSFIILQFLKDKEQAA